MSKLMAAALLSAMLLTTHRVAADEVSVVTTFDGAAGESPESVTLDDDGNLYISLSNAVRRRSPAGEWSVHGTLPIQVFVLGIKVGPDGAVYAASTSLDPSIQGAFVWRFPGDGQVAQQYAELNHAGGPNDLAFDDDGNLFVTDPRLGVIYKIPAGGGTPSVWLSDASLQGNADAPALIFAAQGVNGIAFDNKQKNLYVGNLDYGRILKIRINKNGTPQAPVVFAESSLLVGADGIAFDKKENLYVAVNAQDRLALVDEDGVVSVVAEGGLFDAPASVAFGTKGSDKRTLYILAGAFSRVFGLIPGDPHPALLKTKRKVKGLPL